MKQAYDIAAKKSQLSGLRGKKQYDRRLNNPVLQPGDRVLVRNLSERGGPGKLRSYWEDAIHQVVTQKGEGSPVYEVKPESGGGRHRVIHRNLLLPCNDLPFDVKPYNTCRRSKQKLQTAKPQRASTLASNAESSSDEEADGMLTFTPVEPEISPSSSTYLAEEPSTNQECSHAEMPSGIHPPEPQMQPQMDPVLEPPAEEQLEAEPGNGRPTRERRPNTLLTYDTLGTPSFYKPAGLSSTSHNAGVAPVTVSLIPGPLGGIPNVWRNCIWPMTYPTPYAHAGMYPCWIN